VELRDAVRIKISMRKESDEFAERKENGSMMGSESRK
jgi:hypothetical protein